ncbi:hypothetical protein GCM10022234_18800 [Aeromicrobium panaciterrae]
MRGDPHVCGSGSPDRDNRVYDNHTVLLCRTRRGKIVRREDYYLDTVRMAACPASP